MYFNGNENHVVLTRAEEQHHCQAQVLKLVLKTVETVHSVTFHTAKWEFHFLSKWHAAVSASE